MIAQGRTIQETIEIARDLAEKLIDAKTGTVPPTIAESLWLIRRGQTDAEGQGRVAYLKREMVKGLPI